MFKYVYNVDIMHGCRQSAQVNDLVFIVQMPVV